MPSTFCTRQIHFISTKILYLGKKKIAWLKLKKKKRHGSMVYKFVIE